jgi:hypothetical protein
MNHIKIVKPDGERIYDWMCTSEGLEFDFLIGFDSDEETLGNIAELIEAAISQCTLECPLEWEEHLHLKTQEPCLWSAEVISGECIWISVNLRTQWFSVSWRQNGLFENIESLEAAKQAAQGWVNEKLNGGE